MRWIRNGAALSAVALALAACTGGGGGASPTNGPSERIPRGGTLHVLAPTLSFSALVAAELAPTALDPQHDYFSDEAELFRCCLLRTLLSYSGRPTAQGGADVRPDLATALPTISSDGLTWTFHIRAGIDYAPPLGHTEVAAADVVRALERLAHLGSGVSSYFSVVQGFDAYAKGDSASIAGLSAPDPHTLVVHVSAPTGDLGYRFSLPPTAPIPPLPGDPTAPMGVATGHDKGDGAFLVGTGPYMIQGSQDLNFSLPPTQQHPVSGWVPGTHLILVRNPSWSSDTDSLRPAYVDQIDIEFGGTVVADAAKVEAGSADLTFYAGAPPQVPLAEIRRISRDASLGHVYSGSRDFVRYVSMNLAMPPFDDVHVRRAVNFVLDKQTLVRRYGGAVAADVLGHIGLNSEEGNLLAHWDPYGTSGQTGSPTQAKEEMARSSYDANHDGICDASVCLHVSALAFNFDPFRSDAPEIRRNLQQIGIQLDLTFTDPGTYFRRLGDPRQHVALGLTNGWGKDFPNGSTYFLPLFSSDALSSDNYSLLGATSAQLRSWGYGVASTPNVDAQIAACLRQIGSAQAPCWARLDQYLMQEVVPWAPYLVDTHVDVVAARVRSYSFDQFASMPALDRISVAPASAG